MSRKIHKTLAERFVQHVVVEQVRQQLSVAELAKRAGTSRQYIYLVLDNKTIPSLTMVESISAALGRRVEDMIK